MSITMNQKKVKALANEPAKDLKTSEDLSALSAQVMRMTSGKRGQALQGNMRSYVTTLQSPNGSTDRRITHPKMLTLR